MIVAYSESTNSFFEEPWWLDAATEGSWDAVEITEGNQVVARLPFAVQKRYGLRVLAQPALTQTLGPWLLDTGAGDTKRRSREKDLFERLIHALPAFDVYRQSFHPNITNWLPFYWQGFEQSTRYTNIIPLDEDEQTIFARFTRQHRAGVKKAQAQTYVERSEGLDTFLDVNEKTFAVQGMPVPYSRDYVARLDGALSSRNKRFILLARDQASDAVHGGIYVAGDERRMYLLMSGTDPVYRSHRAGTLLVWEAIKEAKSRGTLVFDFEGSMIEPIEAFYRGFGPVQVPFHSVSKQRPLLTLAETVRSMPKWRRR